MINSPQDARYIVRKSFILLYVINYHEVITFLVYVTVPTEEHTNSTIHIEPIYM